MLYPAENGIPYPSVLGAKKRPMKNCTIVGFFFCTLFTVFAEKFE